MNAGSNRKWENCRYSKWEKLFIHFFQRHDPFVSRMCLIQHAEIYIKASYGKIAKLAALQGCLAI